MSHIAELARKERANRGKYAEGKARDYLKKVSDAVAAFDYKRVYDTRSARTKFLPRQAGDFDWWTVGRHGVVEVKEVAHDFRLPRKNFEPKTKFGVLRKRQLAGGEIIIAVCHTTTKLWRCPDFEFFRERSTQPSWDLSEFRTFESVDALLTLRGIALPR